MNFPTMATTELRRYSNAVYSVKELISKERVDGYEHMIDTLLLAVYGIEDIIVQLNQYQSELRYKERSQKTYN